MSLEQNKLLNIDFSDPAINIVRLKQGSKNTTTIIVTCYNDGVLVPIASDGSVGANFLMKKPDGNLIANSCTINADGTISIMCTEQVLAAAGKGVAEIMLVESATSKVIKTMNFYVMIYESSYQDEELISTSEFKSIAEVLLAAQEIEEFADELEEFATLSKSYAEGNTGITRPDGTDESTDNSKYYASLSKTYADEAAKLDIDAVKDLVAEAKADAESVVNLESDIETFKGYADSTALNAKISQSYAVGGTDYAHGDKDDDVDNAKYYYELVYNLASSIISGGLVPIGTITFQQLCDLDKSTIKTGYMYNISDKFTSTDDFIEGAGHVHPAGSNVYYTASGKWDCLSGAYVTSVNGEKGDITESISYDNTTNVLSFKSGENVVSTTTILSGGVLAVNPDDTSNINIWIETDDEES